VEEGLKYIEDNEPVTVVILDFIMRGMNGLEFLNRVCRINCAKGLINYQNRKWDEVKKCFENSLMSRPEDGLSKIYLKL
jgi:CheY-like chemotaxis protein